jgi:hypothetical protein
MQLYVVGIHHTQLDVRAGHYHGSPDELGETEGGGVDGGVVVPEGLLARSLCEM